ncbi:uncharacterized protein LOC112159352 [Oryzias melastigma]|uniref:uncharacterized protein LOC112159352 n=1 Tax=Oryzias melastigma TaxID=30732 RepID=UPI000CF7C978|nr:uncharacterized protein LOC112159352 [Oryzias melastigma]
MATEYLECRRWKKVGGWSQGIIRQLAPTYSCQFPAVLTYNVRGQFPPPPPMPPLPSPVWLLSVYGYDVLTRLDEYKVTKKLAGAASDSAAWATNVGHERGQVLMSVLTCSEGAEGPSRMAAGLMRRYRLAKVPPPQLIYVDQDCCSRDGVSKTAALFSEWERLEARLDIWHPVYRCARDSTSLESFHLHLQRFIPGTSARPRYFQAFLIDGLVRWNEDRAAAAAPPPAAEDHLPPLHSYSDHLKHALNQKSQRVLGHHLVKDFTKPAAYTGELIGVEYLFQQTGSVLEGIGVFMMTGSSTHLSKHIL